MFSIKNKTILQVFSDIKNEPKFNIVIAFAVGVWAMAIPFDNSIYQAGWVSINILFLFHLIYYKKFNIVKDILNSLKPLVIIFFGLWGVLFISNTLNLTVLSDDSWKIAIYFGIRFGLVFLGLCYFYKLNIIDDKKLIYFYITASLIVAVSGLWYLFVNYQNILFFKDSSYGIMGVFRNRNSFGLSAGLGLVFILVFLKNGWIKNTLIAIFLLLIIFSFSRSSWFGSISALVFYAIFNIKTLKKEHFAYIALGILAVATIYFFSDSLQYRFSQLASGYSSHRFGIWSYTFSKFLEQPFFGFGLDSFQHLPNAPFLANPNYSAPHNMILDSLYHTGIVGFMLFIGINLYIFLTILKTKNFKVMTIFIFIFTTCQFDFGIFGTKELLSVVVIASFLALKDRIKT